MPKSSRQIVEYSDEMAAALFEAYEPRAEDERDVAVALLSGLAGGSQ